MLETMVLLSWIVFAIIGSWCLKLKVEVQMQMFLFIGVLVFGAVSSVGTDFFYSFVALEFLGSLALVMIYMINSNGESLLKYFVFNSICSALVLISFAVTLLESPVGYVNTVASVFMYIGLLGKIGLYPWSLWLADVYSACSIREMVGLVNFFKVPYLWFFFKWCVLDNSVRVGESGSYILISLSSVSIVFGAVGSLNQRLYLSRFFAYSSFVQSGYFVLLCSVYLMCGVYSSSFSWGLVYIYLVVSSWIACKFDKFSSEVSGFFSDLRGSNLSGWSAAFGSMALAGFPLGLGFLPKYALFFSLFNSGYWFVLGLFFFNSVVVLVYYSSVVKLVWYDYRKFY